MATASVNPRPVAQWRITAQDVEREIADVIEDCAALGVTDSDSGAAQTLIEIAADVFAAHTQARQIGSSDDYYYACVRRVQALLRGATAISGASRAIRAIGGSLLKRADDLSKALDDVSLAPEGGALAMPGNKTEATTWLLQALALSDKLAPSLAADLIDKPEIAASVAGLLTAMDAELVGAFALTDKAEIVRAMDAADKHLGGIMDAYSAEGLTVPLSWGLMFGIDKTLSDGAEWVRTCDEPGNAAPSEIRTIARALTERVPDLTNALNRAGLRPGVHAPTSLAWPPEREPFMRGYALAATAITAIAANNEACELEARYRGPRPQLIAPLSEAIEATRDSHPAVMQGLLCALVGTLSLGLSGMGIDADWLDPHSYDDIVGGPGVAYEDGNSRGA